MDFYKDTWKVVDNYFSTTPYFLTKHHLDSYNDFVSNKVLNTIRVLNDEFFVIKNENNGATTNEINVYIGGKDAKDVFINKPTIVENGQARLLYPNEARLRDMTYQSELFANIYVNIRQKTVGQNEKVFERVFKNVKIGAIPIMLHSKLCVLQNQPTEVLREMGECSYDQGGYFVVDGKEKVIVAQERIATNRIFINPSKDVKYAYEGLIRCTSAKNPLFPKTNYLYVNAERENSDMIDNAVSINLPRVTKPIPIFILFRALGVESDKDIMEYITYDVDDLMNKKIVEFLRYSALDCHGIYTQEDAMKYMAAFGEYKGSIDNIKYTLVNDLFPNVGTSFKNKALFLGHIVQKIVKVALGIVPPTDRDDYKFKRVDISGFLLGNLFRDYYNQFRNVVRNNIDKAYNYGPWKTSGIENLVNKSNLNTIFQSYIIADGMRKSLKGSWGKLMMKENLDYKDLENIKQEVVQDLNRFSYAGTISHLRRCNTPLDPSATKLVGPHKLHTSQWGIMCPTESPDGASIGLLKNFAMFANVSFDVSPHGIEKFLEEYGLVRTELVAVKDVKTMTKVSINSNWIGVVEDPYATYRLLKLMKRNALINTLTSISWDIINSEINILTESGRCYRPTYVVKDNQLLITKYLEAIEDKKVQWIDLIRGELVSREDFSLTFEGFKDPKKVIKDKLGKSVDTIEDIIKVLETTQAPIEYSDPEETNGHLVAMDGDAVGKDGKSYTHCEIHASTILSAIALNTPFSDHNQAPRNIFSTGQCKQSIGVYATNYNNRIDTMTYVMNYPQRPICATRYSKYTNFDTMVHGQNLIVAIATYTGYNQEDSIIFNKTSVERGMFNLTYYKNMNSEEEENKKDNEIIRFANPMKLIEEGKNLTDLKFANYNKLDENGYPKVNSYIHEGDAIIGRCKVRTEYVEDENSKKNIFNNTVKREVYEDRSIVADKTVSGIIDKVFVYFDDNNNKKMKIRFRKNRDSQIGDKNCSRAGQKGVCGALIPEENMPFTKDGVKPDIIINPHAIPSRMTIGHLFESVLSKYGVMKGEFMDATPFNHNNYEPIYDMLEKDFGMERHGNEILYNGFTGDQIQTEIFFGPTYYQKLKHMVLDKYNYRSTGPRAMVTRQPCKGRAAGGGLAVGNMESFALIAHGISAFMKECMMEKGDKYQYNINNNNGNIAIVNEKNNMFKAYPNDEIPSQDFSTLQTPYCFKLLSQELMTMSLKPTIYTHAEYMEEGEDENYQDIEVDVEDDNEE
jgi:DNA-directed RNA polymerase II subunit RPB2